MRVETKLGLSEAIINAPARGELDPWIFETVFPGGQLYGLDVETTRMGPLGQWAPDFTVRLIQFATVDHAWVLDLSDPVAAEAARKLLSDETVFFCSHHNMDVLSVFTQLGVDISARNVDTHVLASMAWTDARSGRDLKTLTTQLIGPQLEQAEEALMALFDRIWTGSKRASRAVVDTYGWCNVDTAAREYVTYAGLDAIACRRLVELLVGLTHAPPRLLEVETWLAGEANRLQERGMLVDTDALEELWSQASRAGEAAASRVAELTGGLKIRSPRLHDWLGEHGVQWSRWESLGGALTDKGRPSLAKDNALLLRSMPCDEVGAAVVEEFITFQGWQDRLIKTSGIRSHVDDTHRLRPGIHTVGASATARMSSSGPNVQNISKADPRTRGVFIADPGYVLVTCDFDQIELRVAAALAGEQKMIEAIERGDDLHQLTADAIGRRREIGKMTNFLIIYGGGPKALSAQAGISMTDARDAVSRFRDTWTAIADLSTRCADLTTAIFTATGRRLEVGRDKVGNPRYWANVNYLIQSTARDMLVAAWHRFGVVYGRAEMVWLPVHDELVCQIPEDLVEQVLGELVDSMTFTFRGVPITSSARVLRDEDGVSRWGK